MRSIFTLFTRRIATTLLSFLLSLSGLFAQTHTPKTVAVNDACGGYWEYLPASYSGTTGKYPLLIYISGGNGAYGNGTSSSMQIILNQGVPRVIDQNLMPKTFTVNGETTSYIIISPQFRYKPSPEEVNNFIDFIVKAYPRIDPARVCLTGFSIGGDVAWKTPYDLASANRLAALVPVAGYNNPYSDDNAQFIAAGKLPVWAIHSNADAAPVSWTVSMVNKINSYNPAVPPVLSRPDGLSHEQTHVVVYEPSYKPNGLNVYEWCLQFRRSVAANAPVANAGADKTITLPTNSVTLNGSATDADGGTLTYAWTKISGPASFTIASPASASTAVNGLTAGEYQFQLEVTDPTGLKGKDTVKVTVQNAPNKPPVANAGADQTITLPVNSVSLTGSQSSDPDGSIAAYQWRQIAGPSSSTLSNATSANATAGSLVAGTYSFELLVKDNNNATDKDTVVVLVKPAASTGGSRVLKVNIYAGSIPAASEWNNWNVQGNLTLSNAKWADGSASGISVSLSSSNAVADNAANYPVTMCPVEVGRTTSYSTILRNLFISGLDNSKQYELEVYSSRSGSGNTTKFTVGSKVINILSSNNYASKALFTELTPVAGEIKLIVERLNTYNYINGFTLTEIGSGGRQNQPPVANAGNDVSITLPQNSVTLNASGSSDPDGSVVSYSWTKLSGPASFSISNANAANPVISNLTAGTYVLQLTVTDNEGATAKDTVVITVNAAPNAAPVANAGSNQSLNLPSNSATLNGTGSSDADGTITSYQWRQISGPGTATLNNAATATATATNLVQGVYRFELTVRDNGNAEAKDTTTVTVNPATLSEKIIKVNIYGGSFPAGSEWNNWNVQSNLTYSNLKFSDGASSTISVTMNVSNAIADNGASYPVTMCPAEVGRTASYSTVARYVTLTGLDNTKRYELEVYGSRNGTGNSTKFSIGSTSITVSTDHNYANKAVFGSLIPVSGQIKLSVERLNTYNYINGFVLREVGSEQSLTASRSAQAQASVVTSNVDEEKEISSKGTLGTYPNPFRDNLDVQVNNGKAGVMNVILLNQAGIPVKQLQFVKEQGVFRRSVSLQELQPGIYFLRVQMQGWSKSEKIVKIK